MEIKTAKYVDWSELRKEFSKEMGIDNEYFRKYHKIVGGEYKDCWHVWLWYIDERMYNDSIMPIGWCRYEDTFEGEYFLEKLKEQGYEWSIPFFKAVRAVLDREGVDYIKYYW